MKTRIILGLLLAATVATVCAAEKKTGHTGTEQSSRLYTSTDAGAGGGIEVKVNRSVKNLQAAFAIPEFEPKFVYKGSVSGGDTASFTGLPTAKYDLLLVFEDSFYEGFRLTRDEDKLTPADKTSISAAINKGTQFFNLKQLHRMEGTSGADGQAMVVLQEMRTKPVTLQDASVRSDIQIRSLKLAVMDQVGPGWALTQTREIIRQEVANNERKGPLPHHYNSALGAIRVTDSVKNLGLVDLTKN